MSITYKIEKGIAVPPIQRKGEIKAFLETVKVNDSFVVATQGRVGGLRQAAVKLKYQLATRSLGKDKGFRVWRVK